MIKPKNKPKKAFLVGMIILICILLLPAVFELIHFIRRSVTISNQMNAKYNGVSYSIKSIDYPQSFAKCHCGVLTDCTWMAPVTQETFCLHDNANDFDFHVYISNYKYYDDYVGSYRGKMIERWLLANISVPEDCKIEKIRIYSWLSGDEQLKDDYSYNLADLKKYSDQEYVELLQNRKIKLPDITSYELSISGNETSAQTLREDINNYLKSITDQLHDKTVD